MFEIFSRKLPPDPLDTALFSWASGDVFSLRDLLNGGVHVFGRTGSGKTSSSLATLARAIIAHPESGGFILAASNGDVDMWKRLFASVGMENKLIRFDEHSRHRFNCLDYLLRKGGGTRDIVKVMTSISETLERGQAGGGGSEGRFFIQSENRLLYNAVEILKLAYGHVNPSDLLRFIASAALEPGQVGSEEWEKSFCYRSMESAHKRPKTAIQTFDNELARTFWLSEYPAMSSRTRSSILAGVMNTLHVFNTGIVRELLATTTTISPADMDRGRFILINTPISRLGEEGAFILGAWKYLAEWHTLRRNQNIDNPPMIGFVDEFQNSVNSYDAMFAAEARKYSGCLVALSQSISAYYMNIPGDKGKAAVDALLANFTHKIFHALGDVQTAEYASKLVGPCLHLEFGGSEREPQTAFDALIGRGLYSGSFSERMRPILETNAFMNGLRTGGQANGYQCDAFIIRSGEAFRDGRNWKRVSFSQR